MPSSAQDSWCATHEGRKRKVHHREVARCFGLNTPESLLVDYKSKWRTVLIPSHCTIPHEDTPTTAYCGFSSSSTPNDGLPGYTACRHCPRVDNTTWQARSAANWLTCMSIFGWSSAIKRSSQLPRCMQQWMNQARQKERRLTEGLVSR